jgi:hypothetical protein
MRVALLLGIPSGYVGTTKSAIAKSEALFSGWCIKYIPSNRKEAGILEGMVRHAQEIADQHEDPHFLGFSTQKDRQRLADQIKPYFRFRWFDHLLLKCLGSPDPSPFVRQLASELAEESEWAVRVKPSDANSPLLLPACCFEAGRKHRDMWRHASAYGDPQNIVGAEKAIRGFRNAHNRKVTFKSFSSTYKWVDERDRIYDQDGERHGIAPFPRDWKYSYKIESGFHFDVTQVDGRKFALVDANGKMNHVNSGDNLNVDPHGYVRT